MSATPRPWPHNADPTAEQLAEWLGNCTDDERLRFAQKAIANANEAAACFIRDHEGRIDFLTAEVRRLGADLSGKADQP